MNIAELSKFGIEGPNEGNLIIDIYADWCGPCQFVSPLLEKLRDEGLINLIKVDIDQNRPLGQLFGITAIPTLLFFKDGQLLEKTIQINGQRLVQNGMMIGATGEETFRKILEQM
ncbi:MAG: thioredoxin [Promethearchaeota archaeon]|nr:MAG: thioredoxin [Candidatus Lokiarchaeota archaeon]